MFFFTSLKPSTKNNNFMHVWKYGTHIIFNPLSNLSPRKVLLRCLPALLVVRNPEGWNAPSAWNARSVWSEQNVLGSLRWAGIRDGDRGRSKCIDVYRCFSFLEGRALFILYHIHSHIGAFAPHKPSTPGGTNWESRTGASCSQDHPCL